MELVRTLRKIATKINPVLSNKIMYKKLMKKKLNLSNPTLFNEKINWLKIYNYPSNNFVIKCTDKVKLHDFLKEKKLTEYEVEVIDIWNNADEIDWGKLPNKFVLKCNHGSRYNIVCNDKSKLDENVVKNKLKKWMKEDFGLVSGELHYSKIEKKIICEKYLGENLIDCQIWATNGKILFISYINEPHGKNAKISYSENWEKLNFVTSLPKYENDVKKPKRLDEMIKITKSLSKNIPFLRMDFYILNDETIKISEMTFSSSSGFIFWDPHEINEELGKKIDLKLAEENNEKS